jgi:sulfatase modifying factor 1
MRHTTTITLFLLTCVAVVQAGVRADLSGDAVVDFQTTMDMPFMTVGNPGNAGELSGEGAGGYGPDRICGAVNYDYRIGKFEVTTGQYTEFLNAVAATDTYGLYDTRMWSASNGCMIEQTGSSGSYTYSVAAEWADRPVNIVSWGDAARFANWLTNGMPTGYQDLMTTEGGSYFLNGALTIEAIQAVTRISDEDRLEGQKYYFLPSEDEWYKAAYHANDGVTGNYFDYPTSSDSPPSNEMIDPDPGNSANFLRDHASAYSRTKVGEFENSPSPYGTFDMGGNVWELNEAVMGSWRGVRGGPFYDVSHFEQASLRYNSAFVADPTGSPGVGFRIVEVPEPATLGLLGLGGVALLRRKK